MIILKKILCLIALGTLAACNLTASGPQKILDEMASAMDNNNSAVFLSYIDMNAFAANHIKNMTRNDSTLGSLNDIGNLLGLGNLDELIGSMVDMKGRIEQQLNRGVASGELMAECRSATTPDCPWVPQSLRSSTVVELGPNAAIAKITTPARLTSWIALHKFGEKWLVVGQAVMEEQARIYAQSAGQATNQTPGNHQKQQPSSQPKTTPQTAPQRI